MTVNYNDGKWHGWNGGSGCPVHLKTLVDLRWDNADPDDGIAASAVIDAHWDHNKSPHIVAFRVVKEYREPREWWVTICNGYEHAHATKAAAETYRNSNSNLAVEVLHVREVLE